MVKMLYWMCKAANCRPNKMQIKHVVLRNFSGYEGFDPLKIFFARSVFNNFENAPSKEDVLQEWKVQIKQQFKEDECALELLKNKLLESCIPGNGATQEEEFYRNLEKGQFPDYETQQYYEHEFEKYFQQKFEGKVSAGCIYCMI